MSDGIFSTLHESTKRLSEDKEVARVMNASHDMGKAQDALREYLRNGGDPLGEMAMRLKSAIARYKEMLSNARHGAEFDSPPHSETANDHPFNQMRARKNTEAMAKIAKHYKKDPKDLTNDEIVKYNQRNFKPGDPQKNEAVEDAVHDETGAVKAWDGKQQPSTPSPERPQSGAKGFRITYEIVTPESAENGEAEESGFLNEEGESMDPDEDEVADGLVTAVDRAIEFLKSNTGEGGIEWSGGSAEHGWWTSYKVDVDYRTGAEESRGYHPYGFTPEDISVINQGLKRR